MNKLLKQLGGALICGTIGLAMMLYALERTALISLARNLGQGDGETPFRLHGTLFVGLVLLNLAIFHALIKWSDYLRANPRVPQLPVWFAVLLIVISGVGFIIGMATHAGYLRTLAEVPTAVDWGYLSFQLLTGLLVLVLLVLLAARWSPGYKQRLEER